MRIKLRWQLARPVIPDSAGLTITRQVLYQIREQITILQLRSQTSEQWRHCVPRPTQPSIPLGSVNEDQLWLGRQKRVRFIRFVDKRVGVQVKL